MKVITINFILKDHDRAAFDKWLTEIIEPEFGSPVEAFHEPGDTFAYGLRPALAQFALEMEAKLAKNDDKTTWRDRPIEALVRLLLLEIEEFKVALEFFEVAEARKELYDVANYCMIVSDRLSLLDQNKTRGEQDREITF